jgi:hypothetical protein
MFKEPPWEISHPFRVFDVLSFTIQGAAPLAMVYHLFRVIMYQGEYCIVTLSLKCRCPTWYVGLPKGQIIQPGIISQDKTEDIIDRTPSVFGRLGGYIYF